MQVSDETLNAAAEYGYAVLWRDKAFKALQDWTDYGKRPELVAELGHIHNQACDDVAKARVALEATMGGAK